MELRGTGVEISVVMPESSTQSCRPAWSSARVQELERRDVADPSSTRSSSPDSNVRAEVDRPTWASYNWSRAAPATRSAAALKIRSCAHRPDTAPRHLEAAPRRSEPAGRGRRGVDGESKAAA